MKSCFGILISCVDMVVLCTEKIFKLCFVVCPRHKQKHCKKPPLSYEANCGVHILQGHNILVFFPHIAWEYRWRFSYAIHWTNHRPECRSVLTCSHLHWNLLSLELWWLSSLKSRALMQAKFIPVPFKDGSVIRSTRSIAKLTGASVICLKLLCTWQPFPQIHSGLKVMRYSSSDFMIKYGSSDKRTIVNTKSCVFVLRISVDIHFNWEEKSYS